MTLWKKCRAPRLLLLFDLDGTLIDSVYQHVLAWRKALDGVGLSLSVWRIHRRIGMITRGQVQRAKPDPDPFLAAAQSLKVSVSRAIVVGDSVWDLLAARRAGCLGIGLLSGGYGREELQQVGAYRVYQDPADLLLHLDEFGIRQSE